jgi:hypothetical protein
VSRGGQNYDSIAHVSEPRGVSKSKLRQSAKLREIAAALEADGFIGLDAQAKALGLSRSTAWTILRGSHTSYRTLASRRRAAIREPGEAMLILSGLALA